MKLNPILVLILFLLSTPAYGIHPCVFFLTEGIVNINSSYNWNPGTGGKSFQLQIVEAGGKPSLILTSDRQRHWSGTIDERREWFPVDSLGMESLGHSSIFSFDRAARVDHLKANSVLARVLSSEETDRQVVTSPGGYTLVEQAKNSPFIGSFIRSVKFENTQYLKRLITLEVLFPSEDQSLIGKTALVLLHEAGTQHIFEFFPARVTSASPDLVLLEGPNNFTSLELRRDQNKGQAKLRLGGMVGQITRRLPPSIEFVYAKSPKDQ